MTKTLFICAKVTAPMLTCYIRRLSNSAKVTAPLLTYYNKRFLFGLKSLDQNWLVLQRHCLFESNLLFLQIFIRTKVTTTPIIIRWTKTLLIWAKVTAPMLTCYICTAAQTGHLDFSMLLNHRSVVEVIKLFTAVIYQCS